MSKFSLANQRTDKFPSFGRHRKLYWIVFVSMVTLTLGNQVVIQHTIQEKMYDEHIVNLAGRQRMLSQKIVKTAYRALMTRDPEQIVELKNLTETWNEVHWGLQQGSDLLELPPLRSEPIQQLFTQMQPHQTALFEAVNRTQGVDDLLPRVEKINEEGQEFLVRMDKIVNTFEADARRKLTLLMRLEIILAVVSILVLMLEIFFVFRPFYRKIAAQNEQLRDIAYIQSHEVRRPVCSILGLMQLIQDEEEPAARAQYVEMLKISTEELERATRQIVERVNEQPSPVPFNWATSSEAASSEAASSEAASSKAASSKAASSKAASSKAASDEHFSEMH